MKPKQIKREDAARLTAEARGWKAAYLIPTWQSAPIWKDGDFEILQEDWNPLASKDQCFELLEEWLKQDEARSYHTGSIKGYHFQAELMADDKDYEAISLSSLNEAIVLAFLRAKGLDVEFEK